MESTTQLLDDLTIYFRRFVVVTPEQGLALALWTMHTYVYEAGDTTPYLVISSAEKRSGKTRLLECLNAVVREPLFTSSMTEAALFRSIHKWKPTMLIDETDALFKNGNREPSERQEAIRSLLNSGFRRGSYTIRCEGQGANQSVARYEIYCPKALAGIGHLPDTIRDRGLPIRLQRRTRDEEVEAFRFRVGAQLGPVFVDQLGSWATLHDVGLQRAEPSMPSELDDRAQDAYELLVAIAELGDRRDAAVAALVQLRNEEGGSEQSTGSQLMGDLSSIIPYIEAAERIQTGDLLALIYEYGDNPWEEWWGEASGKRAPRRLAMILDDYGVKPLKYKTLGSTRRGYVVSEIVNATARYTPINTPPRHPDSDSGSTMRVSGGGVSDFEEEPGGVSEYVPNSGDLQEDSSERWRGGVLFRQEGHAGASVPPVRGTAEWIATASAGDLEKWKREVLDG